MLQKKKRYLFYLPFVAALFLFLLLYSYSFPQGDDFTFVARGRTLPNIWHYYLYYYSVAGSRMANFFAQLLLLSDLSVWKVLTPFVTQGIALLLFYWTTGRLAPREGRFRQDFALACICAFFPGLVPLGNHLFADTFLWMDGSCNYLYPLLFLLIGLLPFWNALCSHPPVHHLRWACPVFFVLAGLMHEQSAVAIFVFCVGSLFFLHKRGRLPRNLAVLTAVSAAILLFTFTCPGAYRRLMLTGQGHHGSPAKLLLHNLAVYFVPFSGDYWLVTTALGLCGLYVLHRFAAMRFPHAACAVLGFGTVLAPLSRILSLPTLQQNLSPISVKTVMLLLYWILFFGWLFAVLFRAAQANPRLCHLPVLYAAAWGSQAIPTVLGGSGRPALPLVILSMLLVLCVMQEVPWGSLLPAQLCTAAVAVLALLNTLAPVSANYASYQNILRQVSAAKAGKATVVVFDQKKFNMHYCYFHSFISAYDYDIRSYYQLNRKIQITYKN